MKLTLVFALVVLVGCPPASDKPPTPAAGGCTKIGQSCEFSPGKLGTCIKRDECTGPDCFVCQSQH